MISFLGRSLNYGDLVNRDAPLNKDRVAWWLNLPLRRGGTRFFDLFGQYNAVLTPAALVTTGWQGALGRLGGSGSLAFDAASSQYADCGNVALMDGQTNFTLSAWFYRTSTSNRLSIYKYDGASTWHGFTQATGGNGYLDVGTSTFASWTDSNTGWNHLAYVFDGSLSGTARAVLYVNGVSQALSWTGTPGTTTPSIAASFELGRAGTDYPTGNLDDVSMWHRSLTVEEVRSVIAASRQGYAKELNRVRRVFPVSSPTATFIAAGAFSVAAAQFAGSASFSPGTKTASAALTTDEATFAGSASHTPPLYDASATLTVDAATFVGSASFSPGTKTASAALTTDEATFAGSASFAPGTKTASAALTTDEATFTGSASFAPGTKTASAALTTDEATFTGIASHTPPTFSADANLTTVAATFTGSATYAADLFSASAALTTDEATFSGSASFSPGTKTATASLTTDATTFTASGEFTAPIFSANVALTTKAAAFVGVALHTPPSFEAIGALTTKAATFAASASFAPGTKTATASLVTAACVFDADATFVPGEIPEVADHVLLGISSAPAVNFRVGAGSAVLMSVGAA